MDIESAVTRIPVTTEPKRLVNGPYWNLNCGNPCSFVVATEFFSVEKLECCKHAL